MKLPSSGINRVRMFAAVTLWLVLAAASAGTDRIGFSLITAIHTIHGVLLLTVCHRLPVPEAERARSETGESPGYDGRR